MKLKLLCFLVLPVVITLYANINLNAAETLPGGILGATRDEVRAKLGEPTHLYIEEMASRRNWLFPVEDIDKVKPMLWADPDIPVDDVFSLKKDGKPFRYRVHYAWDKANEAQPVLRVAKCWAYFLGGPVKLADMPGYVPEFEVATRQGVKAYVQKKAAGKHDIVVMFLSPDNSALARRVSSEFREPVDDYEWSPCFQVVLAEGESENVSLESKVKEAVVTVESQKRLSKLARVLNIKDIETPFSS
ncbi:MAG: hypothetical protein V3W00_02900 [Candidatus Brocadiales bacterium]